MPTPEPLWGAEEVRRRLDVSERTYFRLRHQPDFPRPVKLGRLRRFRPEDVEEYIRRRGRGR